MCSYSSSERCQRYSPETPCTGPLLRRHPVEVHCVSQRDGRTQEREAAGASLRAHVGAVPELAEAVEEVGPRQHVPRPFLVEPGVDLAPQLSALVPREYMTRLRTSSTL